MSSNPVFVAIDTPDLQRALSVSRAVRDHVGGLKIGLEFITACGPDGVRKIVEIGLPVFADVKFHDIPNTVAGASRELARLGASIFNVHTSGGEEMMREGAAAARAIDPKVKVIGVTVLTSLDELGARLGRPARPCRRPGGSAGAACPAFGSGRGGLLGARDRGHQKGLRDGLFAGRSRHPPGGRGFGRPEAGDDPSRSPPRRRRYPGHWPANHGRCRPRRCRQGHSGRASRNNGLSKGNAFA